MISMARWICDTAMDYDVVFFHSARTPHDIIMRQELELLAARYPNFRLVTTITQSRRGYPWYGFVGRLNDAMLTSFSPDFRERTVYVCGPHAFMESAKALLTRLEFPMENYYEESFGGKKRHKVDMAKSSEVPVAKLAEERHTTSDATSLNQPSDQFTPPSEIISSELILVFATSNQEAVYDEELSILEVAEQEGVRIRSSCKQGICGACRVRKLEGDISYESEPEALDSCDQEEGYILPCIASAIGRVVIEA